MVSFSAFLGSHQFSGGALGPMASRTGPVLGYDCVRGVVFWSAAVVAAVVPADVAAAVGRVRHPTAACYPRRTEAWNRAFARRRHTVGASFAWVAPCCHKALRPFEVTVPGIHTACPGVGAEARSRIARQRSCPPASHCTHRAAVGAADPAAAGCISVAAAAYEVSAVAAAALAAAGSIVVVAAAP